MGIAPSWRDSHFHALLSQHRKKAILGWLAFVALAIAIGGTAGTRTLDDAA
jgi:hypothetical protein